MTPEELKAWLDRPCPPKRQPEPEPPPEPEICEHTDVRTIGVTLWRCGGCGGVWGAST